jgi:hypothetical protein
VPWSGSELIASSVSRCAACRRRRHVDDATLTPTLTQRETHAVIRRILPDRQFDRIILRAGGLDGF